MDAGFLIAILAVAGAFGFVAGYCIGVGEGENSVGSSANGNYIRCRIVRNGKPAEGKPVPPQGGSGTARMEG